MNGYFLSPNLYFSRVEKATYDSKQLQPQWREELRKHTWQTPDSADRNQTGRRWGILSLDLSHSESSGISCYEKKSSPEFILFQWQQKLTIDVSQSRTRNPEADDGKNATDEVSNVDNNARVSSQLLLYDVVSL